MPTKHIVMQGECLSHIAAQYGFADYRVIYDDPANATFRKTRPNPNVTCPGDVLVIPDRRPKTLSLATGSRHKVVITRPPAMIRLEVQVAESHFYHLQVGNQMFKGKTDGKAPFEHSVSPLAESGRIDLWPAVAGNETKRDGLLSWDLLLGHLDPIQTISGVQARLANLGYYNGPVDDTVSSDLTLGIAAFELKVGLDVTGDPGNLAMQRRLHELHDQP